MEQFSVAVAGGDEIVQNDAVVLQPPQCAVDLPDFVQVDDLQGGFLTGIGVAVAGLAVGVGKFRALFSDAKLLSPGGLGLSEKRFQLCFVGKPVLLGSEKHTIAGEQFLVGEVVAGEEIEADSPAFQGFQRIFERGNEVDEGREGGVFENRSVVADERRIFHAELYELLHHFFVRLHVPRLLLLDDAIQRRLRDVDAPLFDQFAHVAK